MTVIPIVFSALGSILKWLVNGFGNMRKNGDYTKYSIIKIGQNIEKSPGD